MMSIVSKINPWRKNLASLVFKILVLLFVISMASKFYLLSFPDLSLKERGFLFPHPKIIRDAQRVVVEEKPLVSRNNHHSRKQQVAQIPAIWRQPSHEQYYKCSQRSKKDMRIGNATDGYIIVNANGGLTQMRAGISDMVAIAHLMNATLVQPKLDHNSYWKDRSDFEDIFDWKRFVEVLKDDVTIIESLPPQFQRRSKVVEKAPISWSKANYYKWEMSRMLKKHKVVSFTYSDSRLANNGISGSVQRLRCRAMFDALQYTDEIKGLANKFINTLRSNNTPYLALHLRYEKDILAFTGCTHNLTVPEVRELTKMRRRTRHWKKKRINGRERRQSGACPMTPREVAMFLEALGFPNDTKIYIAAGDIYGQNGLQPLLEKFPNVYNHASLASKDDLVPFKDSGNKLAALDYMVALDSDVFIYTYDGHMAKAVKGHRLYEGFRKTISPDIRRFVRLIDQFDNKKMSWDEFSSTVKRLHKGSIGAPIYRRVGPSPRLEENFYSNSYPGCICETSGRW